MKRYILLLIVTFIFSSCSEFLNEEPKGDITSGSYYKTEQHAISATNAIYDYLIIGYAPDGLWDAEYGGVFFNYYWVLQDLFSDNAHTHVTSTEYQSIDNFQIDAYNESVEHLWRDFYQTIKACNIVIDKVPDIEMDDKLKANLIGEARFFRGMMYFDLVRMFGDVPLRVHDIEGADEEIIPSTSSDEIYNLIIDDLKYAEANLNYEDRQGGGRPYPLSATALLARVYNTYAAEKADIQYRQLAVDCAKKVIPEFPMMSDYADIFKISNRFNSEIVWGANFNATLSEGWKGGQFLVRLLPSLDQGKGGLSNAQGWESATENLYDDFETDDARREVTLATSFTYDDGSIETFISPYFFKYWDREAEPNGNNSDAIFPAIRTPEMYLIIAEAENEINHGANTEALNAIKTVRSRAGLSSDDLPTNYDSFRKAVLHEYRVEFAMEGHRWFDLKRMCTPSEFVNIVKEAKPDATPHEYNIRFPIPQREINRSNGEIKQNVGYEQ